MSESSPELIFFKLICAARVFTSSLAEGGEIQPRPVQTRGKQTKIAAEFVHQKIFLLPEYL